MNGCDKCECKNETKRLEPTAAGRQRAKIKCPKNCQCHDAFNFVHGNVPMQVPVTV